MKRLLEQYKILKVIDIQDIRTERTSGYISVCDFRKFVATLVTGTIAEGKKAKIEFVQAKDNAGTGVKTISGPLEYTAGIGGGKAVLNIENSTEDLDDGYNHIGIRISTDDTNIVNGCATLILGDARNNPIE